MRFSVIAAAFMASAVYAGESTLYITEEVTITSCAPYVYSGRNYPRNIVLI